MPITPERVAQIIAMDDQPVLRNLLITDGYHRLALAMADLFGEDSAWPQFAVWASKQAGGFIRGDELPLRVRERLDAQIDVGPSDVSRTIVRGISIFVGGGNDAVFAELGAAFSAFHQTFAEPAARTTATLAAFVERFAEGPSEPDVVELAADGSLRSHAHGGQTLLREAMGHYFTALHERDGGRRAELVLLGNALCGLHEQIRLQPYIAGALDHPVERLLQLARMEHRSLGDGVSALVRRMATEMLMILPLPQQVLYVGEDLPAPLEGDMWPEPLERIEHPRLLDLAAQLGAYDVRERSLGVPDRIEGWLLSSLSKLSLARPEAQGSAARDWTRLSDRMRYIFELFRSRQRDPSLRVAPFSAAQQVELECGRLPSGPL